MSRLTLKKRFEFYKPDEETTTISIKGYTQITEQQGVRGAKDFYLVGEAVEKLADYEVAEENGLLIRLPCKIGDRVYRVLCSNDNFKCYVFEVEVYEIVFYGHGMFFRCIDAPGFSIRDFGKSVFATKAEAEAILQAVEQKEGK